MDWERLFDLDVQLLADSVLTLIAVFVLFLVMSHFLFNPARKYLESRRDRIKNDLDSAAADKAEASKLRTEYEDRLHGVEKEKEAILSEARKKAIANENQIIADAKEEAGRIIEHANKEAELEKAKVADDVKKEMIDVAFLVAGKVAGKNIDADAQGNLIDETLKEIGESTWLS